MGQFEQQSQVMDWQIENLPLKIMWMDQEGAIVYANAKFCERLGYKQSEALSLNIFDINPSATAESWKEHWKEVKKKKVHTFKSVHQTKKGKYYDVEVFAQFFSNNGKEIICAIVNEITESSFYKNLLTHSERLNAIGGWKLNLQDGSLIVTEMAYEIFQVKDNEAFLPRNIIERFDEPEHLKELLRKVMRKAEAYDEVLSITESNGNKRFIRCVAEAVVKRDKIFKVVGTYQDVTQETEKTNRLRIFKDVFDRMTDFVVFRTKDAKIQYFNKAFQVMAALPEEQILGKSFYEVAPNYKQEFEEDLWKGHETQEILIPELDIVQNGKLHNLIGTNYLVEFEGQLNMCTVGKDITEIKSKEIQLKKALDELSELKDELEIDNQYLREEISSKLNLDNIICQSEEYRRVLEQVTQVAVTDTTVLITGESGTGKELLASAVHLNSKRTERALIKVNCATLPKELIESELFGHKKGAFTGAVQDKLGKFSLADGGTIFLDEIGEVPIDLQAKLLRVLQEGEFDQLGATKTSKVDVRVIAATNRNLEEMVKNGSFREDLYYRLNVFPIHNIPLRERKSDIPLLAQFFLERYAAKAGKNFSRLSKKTIALLMDYNFPGNIRELENLIERAVITEQGPTLKPGSWIPLVKGTLGVEEFKSLEATQREYIIKVLDHTGWRVSGPKGAARILDMKDKTLFARMKKLGIEKQVSLKK
ncbi:sigma 54-interacting transcriptional regulator [Gilvibacter sp.]|uniref:sigma 54-interacting transcriptional regulator n=1 Tax=Gilvibacter sp. TaxID=2729997 RepID=UPI0025B9CF56|nr:sigma 54-interacting transcriptional regulator [Gilvibacter sp.]NQX77963.1 sigma 54-interacting transcriptional regulator [Gilvibacter sp.]